MEAEHVGGIWRARTDCRGCHGTGLEEVIAFGPMPLAGGFLEPEKVGDDVLIPLTLDRCPACSLMQVREVVDPSVIFSTYSYASSTTKTLSEHFEGMAGDLVALGVKQGDLVVEFGCNDGVLIRPLRKLGVNAVGIDPSDVALRASTEGGWPLVTGFLNMESAREVLRRFGPARVVVGNNVFAHMDDLDQAMAAIVELLDRDGFFVFEVHYQGDLIKDLQFDTIYHEHLCYYSLRSLVVLLERFGLMVVDVTPIPIHSGSIRVVAIRKSSERVPSGRVDKFLEKEGEWNIPGFSEGVEVRRKTLRCLVGDLSAGGRRVVAYGAAGRCTVLLNFCGLTKDLIQYVVDKSPLRFGKLVPGVHIPIQPEERFRTDYPDYAVMTAWNYEPEIIRRDKEFLQSGGRFIIPLPQVRIVDGT